MMTKLHPGLILIHGNRAESLRALMVEWIQKYPLAPLALEQILVQGNAIAQWLKLAMASDPKDPRGGGMGIAASMEFSLPSRFMWQVYRAVLGVDAVPETSPFDKSPLTWRLIRLLPSLIEDQTYAPLGRFLSDDDDLRKRYQLAERLADLFDQYQMYRADWLADWASGDDILIDARGNTIPLEQDQLWQPALWRTLLEDVGEAGVYGSSSSRAAVHAAFMTRAADIPEHQRPRGLPDRLLVFGISSMPRQSLEVLSVLAKWSQVFVCVLNPCEHYWADIVSDKELLRATMKRQSKRVGSPEIIAETDLHLHAHPLLAAWGKQGRDYIGLLDEYDNAEERQKYGHLLAQLGKRVDLFESCGEATLLQQLQDDIRELRPLRETRDRRPAIDLETDQSIRFHVAHSPMREVEILHDQLIAAFQSDPELQPQDVIVMVPDINAYAPHIQAVFGLVDKNDRRHIPYSIADQGKRHIDPLINGLELLLGLPQSRIAVSDVLDILDVPAVRSKFGIDDADLPLIHRWIKGANIRWGLHDEHRTSLGLPETGDDAPKNSWLFGLRRMLLGYATGSDGRGWHSIEPYDELGGLDAFLLGPLARLVGAIEETWQVLRTRATVEGWSDRLRALLDRFFATENSDDAYTIMQLESALQNWQDTCAAGGLVEELPLSVVSEYWLGYMSQSGMSQRFFAGSVTFATLMPMRAIPFRHVCLLGMNDGAYPRSRAPLDFDLMGRNYRPGDRSRREDDRYLFLEALLSARDKLYISWVGRSVNDNTHRPPSVLVGQLRDHLASGWHGIKSNSAADSRGETFLEALTTEHPLQPFNPVYFTARDGCNLFSYVHEWQARVDADTASGLYEQRLPPVEREEPLSLSDLGGFLKDPVKSFMQQRLGVFFSKDDEMNDDVEPFNFDGLGIWKLRDELLQAQKKAFEQGGIGAIEGARKQILASIERRGDLPVGVFGQLKQQELEIGMDELFSRYQDELSKWPTPMEHEYFVRFSHEIDGNILDLADWLGDIRMNEANKRARVVLEPSSLIKDKKYRPDKLVQHWVNHLSAHLAGEEITTVVLSRVGDFTFAPLDPKEAKMHMSTLLDSWAEGMCSPLPFAVKTSYAWLIKSPHQEGEEKQPDSEQWKSALESLRSTYEGTGYTDGEVTKNPYLKRAWPSYDHLVQSGRLEECAENLLRPLKEIIASHPVTRVEGVA